MTAFEEFGLMPELGRAVEDMGWLLPTDVQAEAIPLILGGGDVLMAAETGSGKTGAFCLPVLQIVHETLREGTCAGRRKQGGAPSFCMNVNDRDPMFAISGDGLLCQSREHRQWQGARGSAGAIQGKHYYEVEMTDEGLCRVGWSTVAAALDLGTDGQGFGFGGTGKKSNARQFDSYGEPFGLSDVVGCFLDLDAHEIYFSKNGVDLGLAFALPGHLHKAAFYPAAVVKNAELRFNFGGAPFRHPPAGPLSVYKGLASAASEHLVSSAGAAGGARKKGRQPLALILEPSKELAQQTHDQITLFRKFLPAPGVREALLIGGMSAKDQIRALQDGVDIVVGTPGRIEDFVSTGKLDLSQVRFYILDEADGLISQGHLQLLESLHTLFSKQTGDSRRLQMIVASATLHSPDVKRMAEKLMHFPTWIDLKGQDAVPETVHHCVVHIDPTKDAWWHKPTHRVTTDGVHAHDNTRAGATSPEALSEAVKVLKYKYLLAAISKHEMDQAIIFCRTKLDCDHLEGFLLALGGGARAMVNEYSCTCVHGDRRVQERRQNLESFKNGDVRFLICTDVAARGIDVRGIPFVINVTLPDEKENYVHRIGRVGRADRMGLAISLVSTVKEKVWYHSCPSRGKSCKNTRLKDQGGCTIWYDEPQYLRNIQEHLGETVAVVDATMDVPVDEFDGKIVYGEKRGRGAAAYAGHADVLAPSVAELSELEHLAQTSFLHLRNKVWSS